MATYGKVFNQKISFDGFDNKHSVEVITDDVTVNCSPGTHHHGDSNIKLKNVVDYNWELKYNSGHIIAVHNEGNVFAYGIQGKSGNMIRIVNQEKNLRDLIKDIRAPVLDLSFALIKKEVILGSVDMEGSIYVYEIEVISEKIHISLLMHMTHPKSRLNTANNYRIIWCTYLPSDSEENDEELVDDPAKLLVFFNGNKAEVYSVGIVGAQYTGETLCASSDIEGFMEINEHNLDIVDASFSPDGTALATASLDGYVIFCQIETTEKPIVLHKWKPHDGKALSCLFFLDNILNNYDTEFRFWKFAITGSNNNTELKLWSCESWCCLQTIHFRSSPSSLSLQLFMKARLDMTSQYLVLSDINNRTLYILKVYKNDSKQLVLISSVSHFLLPAPFLSFCIVGVEERKKLRSASSSEDFYAQEEVDDFDDENLEDVVEIKMFVVQPKQLQECVVSFQPDNFTEKTVQNGLQNPKEVALNGNDNDQGKNEILNLEDLQPSVNLLIQQNKSQQQPFNLMTPEAFNSHGNIDSTSKSKEQMNNDKVKNDLINLRSDDQKAEKLQKDHFVSGGSSPSREVEEIFSFKNDQEFLDGLMNASKESKSSRNSANAKNNTKTHYETGDNDNFSENFNMVNQADVWSSIPILKASEVLKEENRRQEMQHIQLQQQKDSFSGAVSKDKEVIDSNYMSLNYRINEIESLLQEQNEQFRKLSSDLRSFVKNFKNEPKEDNVLSVFLKDLELTLARNHIQQSKMFDNYFKRDSEQYDKMITSVVHSLSKDVVDKFQDVLVQEINKVILPMAINSFDKLKHQLSYEYSQKFENLDHVINDSITKVITGKTVADSLSASILQAIQPSLEHCYKNMIDRALIPSWEKVCNSMFQQIHDTFTKGTKEYTASVENYMERQRRVQDKGKDLIAQMQAVSEAMKNSAEKLTKTLTTEIQNQLSSSFTNMQDKMSVTIADLVSEQVKQGLKSHVSTLEDSVLNAVRSRAVTPSSHVVDTQFHLTQIQQSIAKGQIDAAFQQALSASDLSLVMYVCEKVNAQDVFCQDKCILPQPVVLSLIQQLGTDLTRQTELKNSYLQEALLNINPNNVKTREHIPTILKELLRQLSNFIVSNPSHKSAKNLRMLQLVTQSLLKS